MGPLNPYKCIGKTLEDLRKLLQSPYRIPLQPQQQFLFENYTCLTETLES